MALCSFVRLQLRRRVLALVEVNFINIGPKFISVGLSLLITSDQLLCLPKK